MSDEITRSEIEAWAQTHCSEMWSWPLGVTARDVVLGILAEQDALRARLAEVEALCKDPNRQRYATAPHNQGWFDGRESAFAEVLAAARGEGDRG